MAEALTTVPSAIWWGIAAIVALVLLQCLRILASEVDWARRLHQLSIETHELRHRRARQHTAYREAQEQAREAARQKREQRKQSAAQYLSRGASHPADDSPPSAEPVLDALDGSADVHSDQDSAPVPLRRAA